eukprot:6214064-Pleurochrysis_carterae.AAC.2
MYRAAHRVGASGHERRQLRERAGVRPAVVDGSGATHRLPPGRVSLSAPSEEEPVRDKDRGGGD